MVVALGFEGNENKIGICVTRNNIVLSYCCRKTYITPLGVGFRQNIVAQNHRDQILDLLQEVLDIARVTPADIDVVCYLRKPRIRPPSICVAIVARTVAQLWNKPTVGVHSIPGHIDTSRKKAGTNNPTVLYITGSKTQLYSYAGHRYLLCGETIDVSVHKCLSEFADILDLSRFPTHAINIEQLAKRGKRFIPLPYVVKGTELSLSEILTYIEEHGKKMVKTMECTVEDLCFSLQETIFTMLAKITERAMLECRSYKLLVVGDIGHNKRFRQIMTDMCTKQKAKMQISDIHFWVDNGPTIAQTGAIIYSRVKSLFWKSNVDEQRFITDEGEVIWW